MNEGCCVMDYSADSFGTVKVLTLHLAMSAEQCDSVCRELMRLLSTRREVVIGTDDGISAMADEIKALRAENEMLRKQNQAPGDGVTEVALSDGGVLGIRAVD